MSANANVIQAHNLGPLGWLLPVRTEGGGSFELPQLLVISDRSGSMGQWSSRLINQVFPTAFEQLGYRSDFPVRVITFDSRVDTMEATVDGLHKVSADSRGQTKMSGVFPRVVQVLADDRPFIIVVVSDGQIHDKDATVRAATLAAKQVGHRTAPVFVSLVRLLTSQRASPDTRALTCIAQFNTGGSIPLNDISTYDKRVDAVILDLIEAIVESLRHSAVEMAEVSAPVENLHRIPGDNPSAMLTIPTGQEYNILVSDTNLPQDLMINGELVSIIDAGVPTNEGDIMSFLAFIESQLRVWAVMGGRGDDIETVTNWFSQLESVLDSASDATVDDDASATLTARRKVRDLTKRLHKRHKSVIGRILQMRNIDDLATLNSAQQAEFLRGMTGRSARRVAQRVVGMDFDVQARDAVRALAAIDLDSIPEDTEGSFYSQEEWRDIIEAAKELLTMIDEVTATDILTIIGGIGVAFRGVVGNYPDPWGFVVQEVYLGPFWLSEADLRTAVIQGGQLDYPGMSRAAPITGVVPLRSICPEAYDLYTGFIAKLQASVTIRGAMAPIPYDRVAMASAVLIQLCKQLGQKDPLTERELSVYTDLLETVANALSGYAAASFENLTTHLQEHDVRPHFSGANGISGAIKPCIALLADTRCANMPADQIAHILRASYGLEVYMAARRAFHNNLSGRQSLLHAVLGVNMVAAQAATALSPPFEDDPEYAYAPVVDTEAALACLQDLDWIPDPNDIAAIARFIVGTPVDPSTVFGVDPTYMRLIATVEALVCSREQDRINTETQTAHGPEYGDVNVCKSWLDSLLQRVYRSDYDHRMSAKLAVEAQILLDRLVQELITCSGDDFVPLITGKTGRTDLADGLLNRGAPGFADLQAALLNPDLDVPDRLWKLWVIVLGRDRNGDEIWANGNIMIGDLHAFAEFFQPSAGEDNRSMWRSLREIKKKYGTHKYRPKENRHGHSNNFPSFWALTNGECNSLDKFRLAVSPQVFADYVAAHHAAGCCGC